jgi:predicted amidophosphoribosyltransferase
MNCFICIACEDGGAPLRSLPLCPPCLESLVTAPRLCPSCAGLGCVPTECRRPWTSHPGIDSFAARYLCIQPGYRVLKRWKITQGAALDRRVLVPDAEQLARLRGLRLDAITWVPQHRDRSWLLGACPAEKIARWMGAALPLPARALLRPARVASSGPRQAERSLRDRMAHRMRWDWDEREDGRSIEGARLLLVDDFMTSGRTLRAAAEALRSRGAAEIHVFCLGIRPDRFAGGVFERIGGSLDHGLGQRQSGGDLAQSAGEAVSVGEEACPLK